METPFLCVLKSGGSYNQQHVISLAKNIWRYNPDARIICMTDTKIENSNIETIPLTHNLKGWFSKLEIFKISESPFLYVDLDIYVTGKIAFDLPKGLYLLRGFSTGAVNSSVMYINGNYRYILEKFLENPEAYANEYSVPEKWGDQDFIRDHGKISGLLQEEVPGLAKSWKRDLNHKIGVIHHPPKILVFHGNPKPENLFIRKIGENSILIYSLLYGIKYLAKLLKQQFRTKI
jgi:hypothetical protein